MKRNRIELAGLGFMLAGLLGTAVAQEAGGPPPPPPQGGPDAPGMGAPGMGPGPHTAGWARMGGEMGDMGVDDSFVLRAISSPGVAEQLGLKDDQVKALREKVFAAKQRQIELNAELEKTSLEQARLMSEKQIDEKAVMAVVEKAGAIRTDLAKARVETLLFLKKTLTPEQIEKARGMMADRFQRMGGRGGDAPGGVADRRREFFSRPPHGEAKPPAVPSTEKKTP